MKNNYVPVGCYTGVAGGGTNSGDCVCGYVACSTSPTGDGWKTTPISADVVRRAVKLCREYALPHARAAFNQMGDTPAMVGAKALLRWLVERDDPTTEFSKRDAFNGCRSKFGSVDELQPALDLLERHYIIRPLLDPNERRGPGRPSSPKYAVNPSHNEQKTQNGAGSHAL